MSDDRLHILLVDDEEHILDFLQRVLRSQYKISRSCDPLEALALIESGDYDVLVSDQRMPSMTGLELLASARKLRPAMTRLILSGYTEELAIDKAMAKGELHNYIAKPVSRDVVLEAILVARKKSACTIDLDAGGS